MEKTSVEKASSLIEEEENRIDAKEAKKAHAEIDDAIPYEDVRKELGLKIRATGAKKNVGKRKKA
jgi:acetyl-CoA carboxylase carboxyltransferase component